jgi:hypothetical protein
MLLIRVFGDIGRVVGGLVWGRHSRNLIVLATVPNTSCPIGLALWLGGDDSVR